MSEIKDSGKAARPEMTADVQYKCGCVGMLEYYRAVSRSVVERDRAQKRKMVCESCREAERSYST
jgi:hypothetical protein